MNRTELSLRSRSLVRDLNNSLFKEVDITNYINEGIARIIQVIPELSMMSPLTSPLQEVDYLPKQWQHLLSVYCASRLCTQDERHYQAATFMNEFETKIADLSDGIKNEDVKIYDAEGNLLSFRKQGEYVRNIYYKNNHGYVPRDYDEE